MRDADLAVPLARTCRKVRPKIDRAALFYVKRGRKLVFVLKFKSFAVWPMLAAASSLLQHIGSGRISERNMIRRTHCGRIDRFARPCGEPGDPFRPPGTLLLRRSRQEGFRIDVAVVRLPGHHLEAVTIMAGLGHDPGIVAAGR